MYNIEFYVGGMTVSMSYQTALKPNSIGGMERHDIMSMWMCGNFLEFESSSNIVCVSQHVSTRWSKKSNIVLQSFTSIFSSFNVIH